MADPSPAAAPVDTGVSEAYRLSETALEVLQPLNLEVWEQIGMRLGRMARSVNWLLGDWLEYGLRNLGEQASQAMDATGVPFGTLSTWRWVAGRVPPGRRRAGLLWSHHCEVASLEEADQERFLDLCEANNWGVKELGAEVRKYKDAAGLSRRRGRASPGGSAPNNPGSEAAPGPLPRAATSLPGSQVSLASLQAGYLALDTAGRQQFRDWLTQLGI
jgi:hypothetical protein